MDLRPVSRLLPSCAESGLGLSGTVGGFGAGRSAEDEPAG